MTFPLDLSEAREPAKKNWRDFSSQQWASFLRNREEQLFLVLTLLIGALVGMVVVAFILLTERSGAGLYPAGGAAWRRLLVPIAGPALMGYLRYRFFPDARGSGVPQTKAALYARGGRISLGTVFGKFFCTFATLASGIPLGREGPAVQVGAGSSQCLAEVSGCDSNFLTGKGVTINLAPADVRKEGSGFDLPMALGLVGCQGQFFGKQLDKMMFLGELSLDGSVRSVRGALSAALAAREFGLKALAVPKANAKEAAAVEGVDVFALRSLPQAVDPVNSPESFTPVKVDAQQMLSEAAL